MNLDQPRSRVRAGVVCLGVVLASGHAGAAQVYPGCAVPDSAPKHVFYIDAVNGDPAGDGSKARPWKSLQAVFNSVDGASPLLSTAPYVHRTPEGRKMSPNPDAPIKPGDKIELMSGDYGTVGAAVYGFPISNSDFVTIEAAGGQTPVIEKLYLAGVNKLQFKGLKIQSLKTDRFPLIFVGPGAKNPTRDIILDGLAVSSQDDISAWSQEEWRNKGRIGIDINGRDQTSCVAVTNSKISNVTLAVRLFADRGLFENNVINNFGQDAIDYAASNLIIARNRITNNNDLGDGNHEDAMQGQIGRRIPGVPFNQFNDILIDSNVVIRQTDPHLKFPTYLQGIDAFDEDWTNVTVTNNVVVTSACWGIGYASLHSSKIINNTVVADGLMPMPGNCKPLVTVGDKTHEGPSSNDVIIRNNIANGLSIYNINPNMTMDHNICLTIEGKCMILTYVGGKPKWGVYKPGEYGDHNIIERRGAAGMFVSFDPAKFVYDLSLRPGAVAIGAGSAIDAPSVDITGALRGSSIDVGAYQHAPLK
jgi:hypothetical protein